MRTLIPPGRSLTGTRVLCYKRVEGGEQVERPPMSLFCTTMYSESTLLLVIQEPLKIFDFL